MGEIIERGHNITSKVCPICSKSFIPTFYWVYKNGRAYYCSYKCYRKFEETRKYRANIRT